MAKFWPNSWRDVEGWVRGYPILAIKVTWAGEATENLTSRTASATVELECFFAPTGDQLIARDAVNYPNGDGILDEDELLALRVAALLGSGRWLSW